MCYSSKNKKGIMALPMTPLDASPKTNNGIMPTFCTQQMDELEDIASQAKIILSQLRAEISSVSDKKQSNTDKLVDTIAQIRQRTDELKHQLDGIANKLIIEAERVFKRNLQVLETVEGQLKLQLRQVREFIQRCDMAQTSNPEEHQLEDIKVILTNFRQEPVPQIPVLTRLRFHKSHFELNSKQSVVGTLNKTDESLVDDTDSILSSSASEASNTLPSSSTALKLTPLKMFTHRAKAISCIATLPDKRAWVSCGGKKLNLVSRDGSITCSLKFDADVNGVACSENGSTTMVCCNDKTIREISTNGKPVLRFKTNGKPLDLCFTPENELVIGFEFAVRKHSLNGELICEATVSDTVNRISVNSSSGDIAVAMDSRLFVLDRNLQHKFEINKTMMENCTFFHPGDVTFDSNQNLLVLDYFSESLRLFDGIGGHHIAKKKPNQISPFCLSIQKGIMLWMGSKNGKIAITRLSV